MRKDAGTRAGIIGLLSIIGLAVLADFLCSDLPIFLRLDGQTYFFPNVIRPAALMRGAI